MGGKISMTFYACDVKKAQLRMSSFVTHKKGGKIDHADLNTFSYIKLVKLTLQTSGTCTRGLLVLLLWFLLPGGLCTAVC